LILCEQLQSRKIPFSPSGTNEKRHSKFDIK
jgi:hypothetical protein